MKTLLALPLLTLALAALLAPALASAAEPERDTKPETKAERAAREAEEEDEDRHVPRARRNSLDHFEMTMGFLGGQRSYSDLGFGFTGDGAAASLGADKLVKPFQRAPFDKVEVLGLRYDARLVLSHIRMTAGFDFPFPRYPQAAATGQYSVGGASRTVTLQSFSMKEGRFGLGGEYAFGPVVPFVDLMGGYHWVNADLAVDGQKASYSASSFAFTLRGGARLHVKKWFFVQAAGEVGLIGDTRWNAELGVGVALR